MEVRDISYTEWWKNILSHLSFTIPRWEVTLIMGPSWAGKTTLLSLL